MQMTLITNPDTERGIVYKLARIIYAQSGGKSLPVVEGVASMIANIHLQHGRDFDDIASDKNLFDALSPSSPRYRDMNVAASNRAFEMCVRVVDRMMHGNLPDTVHGATMFHYADTIPDWAMARGYIADVDGVLFYQ